MTVQEQNSALLKALCDSQRVLQTFNYQFVKDQFYANAAVLKLVMQDGQLVTNKKKEEDEDRYTAAVEEYWKNKQGEDYGTY